MTKPILLCVPGNMAVAQSLTELGRDLDLVTVQDLADVLILCRESPPVVVVLPLARRGARILTSGCDLEILSITRLLTQTTTVLLYGEEISASARQQALVAGATDVLATDAPGFAVEIRRVLAEVVHQARRRLEEEQALITLFATHGIVGVSRGMREVFRRTLKVSQLRDLPVLITGPRGTPRSLLASSLHKLDPYRCHRTFFSLNCAELATVLENTEDLDKKNTAERNWMKLLQVAESGTLFLDQIEKLHPTLQLVLLAWSRGQRHVAEEAEPRLRVVAGTEQPLESAVSEGRFLPDLAQWLGMFRIPLPPLKGHPEDLAAMARACLRRTQSGRDHAILDFEPGLLEELQRLPWEGNRRELDQAIREALSRGPRGVLLARGDLPDWVLSQLDRLPPGLPPKPKDNPEPHFPSALESALQAYERRLLETLLGPNLGRREKRCKGDGSHFCG